jgi:hypothetical protein
MQLNDLFFAEVEKRKNRIWKNPVYTLAMKIETLFLLKMMQI